MKKEDFENIRKALKQTNVKTIGEIDFIYHSYMFELKSEAEKVLKYLEENYKETFDALDAGYINGVKSSALEDRIFPNTNGYGDTTSYQIILRD